MDIDKIKNSIRNVPDFPKPGIQFKDITPLLEVPELFNEVVSIFYDRYKEKNIDVIVGIESRGFIFAAPIALKLNCAFVLARKGGKLPLDTVKAHFDLEYGTDSIEIQKDAIKQGDRILIVDDLIATGGTAKATGALVERLGGQIVSFAFLIELIGLGGANFIESDSIFSIIQY
jgi:adenine phosphoribosyltransferase